jgi:uncharacterized protein (DUF1778 family)
MENKDTNLNIRVSKTTKAMIIALAENYDMKLSDFVLSMVKHIGKTRPVLKTRPAKKSQPVQAEGVADA